MLKVTAILGLGLSALLAAKAFPDARIFVPKAELDKFNPAKAHTAVLRFKTPLVGELAGVPTEKRLVYKGLWDNRRFITPDIRAANSYSRAVSGVISPRSILSVGSEPVVRYVPGEDFVAELWSSVKSRVVGLDSWGKVLALGELSKRNLTAAISTLPLGVWDGVEVERDTSFKPILTFRHSVPIVDPSVVQTVYFPYHSTAYRATLENSVLKVECFCGPWEVWRTYEEFISSVAKPFGLEDIATKWVQPEQTTCHRLGKLLPPTYDDAERRAKIFALSHNYGIYSLGRYATMRNIGLDDIAKDIGVIKKLIEVDSYGTVLYSRGL